MSGRWQPDARRDERIELEVGGFARCGEPEIGVSDSAAETSDGAAKEREKRGFGGRRGDAAFKGCTRDVDATHRVSRFSGPSVGFTGIRPVLLQVLLFLHRNRAVIQLM
jgi:hypothetical protein